VVRIARTRTRTSAISKTRAISVNFSEARTATSWCAPPRFRLRSFYPFAPASALALSAHGNFGARL
jgi:hypothetical protein